MYANVNILRGLRKFEIRGQARKNYLIGRHLFMSEKWQIKQCSRVKKQLNTISSANPLNYAEKSERVVSRKSFSTREIEKKHRDTA